MPQQDAQQLLQRYRALRDLQTQLTQQLLGTLTSETLDLCAERLGFWKDGRPHFNSDLQPALTMDHALYDERELGDDFTLLNAPERRLQDGPPLSGDALLVLEAMVAATLSIFKIEQIHEKLGVRARDYLSGETVFIADQGLGRSSKPQDLLVLRLLRFPSFGMTSGAVLPLPPQLLAPLLSALIMRFGARDEADLANLDADTMSRRNADLLMLCASTGALKRVGITDPIRPHDLFEA